MIRRTLQGTAAVVVAFTLLGGASVAAAERPTAVLDASLDALVSSAELPGAVLIVVGHDGRLYSAARGIIGGDTPVPIASASKWLTTAVIMTLVDDGSLKLDATVGEYLPEAPPAYRAITLRQLLSQSSGIEQATVLRNRDAASSKDLVDAIFSTPLIGPPGKVFAYGGSSMQLAAFIAERRTGRTWRQLFHERLTKPLGLKSAAWSHPLSERSAQSQAQRSGFVSGGASRRLRASIGGKVHAGAHDVPYVAGGLVLSPNDLAMFMRMILRRGELDGVRILSTSAVAEMERLQTGGVTDFRRLPVAKPEWRYGLGLWCEAVSSSGACSSANSAGAFGTVPWVDRKSNTAGVFVTQSQLPKVLDGILAMRPTTTELDEATR